MIKLGVVMEDHDFQMALCKGLSGGSWGIIASAFKFSDFLLKDQNTDRLDMERLKHIDIFIVQGLEEASLKFGELSEFERLGIPLDKTIILAQGNPLTNEGNAGINGREIGPFWVDRLSKLSHIANQVVFLNYLITGNNSYKNKREGCKVVGVTSVVGGAGKTCLSLALGEELIRYKGKSVVYVSLEDFQSMGMFTCEEKGKRGLKEYLYYLITGSCTGLPLETFLSETEKGLLYFSSQNSVNPLVGLNLGEMEVFLSSLRDSGLFDFIILEMGNLTNIGLKEAFNLVDFMCVVSYKGRDLPLVEGKLLAMGALDLKKICLCVRGGFENDNRDNPLFPQLLRENMTQNSLDVLELQEDPHSVFFNNNRYNIRIDGGYGGDIRKLSEGIKRSLEG